jgi:hypothetical protein
VVLSSGSLLFTSLSGPRSSYLVGEHVQEQAVFVPCKCTGHCVMLWTMASLRGGIICPGPRFGRLRSLQIISTALLCVVRNAFLRTRPEEGSCLPYVRPCCVWYVEVGLGIRTLKLQTVRVGALCTVRWALHLYSLVTCSYRLTDTAIMSVSCPYGRNAILAAANVRRRCFNIVCPSTRSQYERRFLPDLFKFTSRKECFTRRLTDLVPDTVSLKNTIKPNVGSKLYMVPWTASVPQAVWRKEHPGRRRRLCCGRTGSETLWAVLELCEPWRNRPEAEPTADGCLWSKGRRQRGCVPSLLPTDWTN